MGNGGQGMTTGQTTMGQPSSGQMGSFGMPPVGFSQSQMPSSFFGSGGQGPNNQTALMNYGNGLNQMQFQNQQQQMQPQYADGMLPTPQEMMSGLGSLPVAQGFPNMQNYAPSPNQYNGQTMPNPMLSPSAPQQQMPMTPTQQQAGSVQQQQMMPALANMRHPERMSAHDIARLQRLMPGRQQTFNPRR